MRSDELEVKSWGDNDSFAWVITGTKSYFLPRLQLAFWDGDFLAASVTMVVSKQVYTEAAVRAVVAGDGSKGSGYTSEHRRRKVG